MMEMMDEPRRGLLCKDGNRFRWNAGSAVAFRRFRAMALVVFVMDIRYPGFDVESRMREQDI